MKTDRVEFLLCFVTALLFQNRVGGVSIQEMERQTLNSILDPKNYDTHIRPQGANGTGATVVNVNMYVRSVDDIDDVKMIYKTQLTFRMLWLDERLAWGKSSPELAGQKQYLTLSTSSKVWIPDLFFSNEKEGHLHDLLKPNVYVRIFPDGQVLYSVRVSLTLSCPMILKLYPLDKQTCSLRMASYGFTTDDLIFKWKIDDPVQVTPALHLPRFALEQFTTDYCDSHTNTGVYSCLRVDFLFRREFSYYLIQVYIPTTMFVIVAYMAFWVDQKETSARITLTLVTLLIMSSATWFINAATPPVSYTKAIDVWTGFSLTFVFSALVICVLVNYWGGGNQSPAESEVTLLDPKANPLKRYAQMTWPKKVDVAARIAYPALFLLFTVMYMATYLLKHDSN